MKRRHFFRSLAAAPTAAALLGQQPAATPGTQQGRGRALAAEDVPKLEISLSDAVADPAARFFNPSQFAALEKLSDILMPALNGAPSASSAGAPAFLDFLIGRSDPSRQALYTAGLDGLNSRAKQQFNQPFGTLQNSQGETLLTPLRAPWTFAEPADPVARFLRAAKVDIRTATMNSREYSAGRRFAGSGLYWYPLD